MYFFSIPVLFDVFFQEFENSKQENVDVFGFVNCKHVRRTGGSEVMATRKPDTQVFPSFLDIQSNLWGRDSRNHLFPCYKR